MVRQTVNADLVQRVAELPTQPGVYLFKDARDRILYVGKASSLRARVGSYFHAPAGLSPRTVQLVSQIRDIETRTTASEAEALLLESTLIDEHQPKYNAAYPTYPLLKLTKEKFPRLIVTRERVEDGSRYFGPYADAGLLRQAVQFMKRVFPLRTCHAFPDTPCLEYHIGQCLAPCVGRVDEAGYNRMVADLVAFLEGRRDQLLRELSGRMRRASRDQRYEEAARVRDQIQALTSVIVAKEKSALAGPLEQLQLALKLPALPRRIEAFDISNIYGAFAVGSMVAFRDGRPFKSHYRRFKIEGRYGISAHSSKTGGGSAPSAELRGGDDFEMMREVVRRRYGGTLAAELPPPDLILVDGGKGQLNAALAELHALNQRTPILGLAKRFEHIVVPGRRDPIVLLPTSPVLHLIQHIRDEAHRFAITYHRRLRGKPVRASLLDEIPGIGPKKKAALLSAFGSIAKLRQAEPGMVAKAARITPERARRLLERVKGDRA